jgi:hypothetical protein
MIMLRFNVRISFSSTLLRAYIHAPSLDHACTSVTRRSLSLRFIPTFAVSLHAAADKYRDAASALLRILGGLNPHSQEYLALLGHRAHLMER